MKRTEWRGWCVAIVFSWAVMHCACSHHQSWMKSPSPRLTVDIDRFSLVTFPNRSNVNESESFRLLARENNEIIIGARNALYVFDAETMTELRKKRIEWQARADDVKMCNYVELKDDCQNFIRLYVRLSNDTVKICGTNAFSPLCNNYTFTSSGYSSANGEGDDGRGFVPFSPHWTNVYTIAEENQLFIGSPAARYGDKGIILRGLQKIGLDDASHMNVPEFVESFEHSHYVYFFFREMVIEKLYDEQKMYSRVARVCKNDRPLKEKSNEWLTFVKARLVCSVGGRFPFVFDMLHSVHQVRSSQFSDNGEAEDVVYAVFTTVPNSIAGHALCVYRMKDIEQAFDNNFYNKFRRFDYSESQSPPHGHPAVNHCNFSTIGKMTEEDAQFFVYFPLASRAVRPVEDRPLLTGTPGQSLEFRHVGVETEVEAVDHQKYDLVYLISDAGLLMRAVVQARPSNQTGHNVSLDIVWQTGMSNLGGRAVRLVPQPATNQLLVIAEHQLTAVQLAPSWSHTDAENSCSGCVGLRDPQWAWRPSSKMCVFTGASQVGNDSLVQNVTTGQHALCAAREPKLENDSEAEPSTGNDPISEKPSSASNQSGLPAVELPSTGYHANGNNMAGWLTASILLSMVLVALCGWLVTALFHRRHQHTAAENCHKISSSTTNASSSSSSRSSIGSYGSGFGARLVREISRLLRRQSAVDGRTMDKPSKTVNEIVKDDRSESMVCKNDTDRDKIAIKDTNLAAMYYNTGHVDKNIKPPSTGSASPPKVRKFYI